LDLATLGFDTIVIRNIMFVEMYLPALARLGNLKAVGAVRQERT